MNGNIVFEIPGNPIAKKRPRFARRGEYTITYNPQETEEGRMLWEIKTQLPIGWLPINAPIKISTIFYLKRPKSHFGSGKNAGVLKKNAPTYPVCKPDIDNLQKMVYDCLNKVVWSDDSYIFESYARKEYSCNPRTEIVIEEYYYGQS